MNQMTLSYEDDLVVKAFKNRNKCVRAYYSDLFVQCIFENRPMKKDCIAYNFIHLPVLKLHRGRFSESSDL